MKKVALLLVLICLTALALPALATTSIDELVAAPGLPQLPMVEAIADLEATSLSGGTCAVIRPIQNHSGCNYSLCESHGCGAPFYFDPIDCACYCGYAY